MFKRGLLPIVLFLFLLTPLYGQFDSSKFNKTAKSLKITRITPAGIDVPSSRQIVFKFNMPVVSVGRMDRTAKEIPIVIIPALSGQWRWLNTSSLALQLKDSERMKTATRYKIEIKPGFTTEDGNKMALGQVHTFTTIRPQIRYFHFQNWKAPGHPVIRLDFNQKVKLTSVMKNIGFYPAGGQKVEAQGKITKSRFGTSVNIEPVTQLPIDTKINLNVKPGILSEEGLEPGKENRTVITFNTFPEFKFIGVRGHNNNDEKIMLTSKEHPESPLFNPLSRVRLIFSAPVSPRMEGPNLDINPDLAGGRTDYQPWADAHKGTYMLRNPHQQGREYQLPLPEVLKAAQTYQIKSKTNFKDIFGRSLKAGFDITFKTDHRPPSLYINNPISVLEKNEQTHLPIYITNIKQVHAKYRLLNTPEDYWHLNDLTTCKGNFAASRNHSFTTGKPEDIAYAHPFKIRDIIEDKGSAVAGVLTTEPETKSSCTNKFFSQVTNLAVHIKIGHHNSTVWVTRLDNGKPVRKAHIELFLHRQNSPVTTGKTDRNGIAILKGTVDIDPYLKTLTNDFYNSFGVVRIRHKKDTAIVPLTWQFSDNSYTYYSNNNIKYSHMRSWGTTSQGIYKAGDTIDFKIYVREQDNRRFILPHRSPYALKVKDPTGKIVHKKDKLILSKFGSYFGSFKVSKNAATGWYNFVLEENFGHKLRLWPLKVLVTDFTPAPFKVKTDVLGKLFKIGDHVEVETSARLHSGGPYGTANTRITATLKAKYFSPLDPALKKFSFLDYQRHHRTQQIFREEKNLDKKGDLHTQFTLKDAGVICGDLVVESSVRDDRGKYIASSASAGFMGRDRLAGIYIDQWVLKEDKEAKVEVVVVDERGQPSPGSKINLLVEYDRVTGSRVKGAGNAYLIQYNHTREVVEKIELNSTLKPVTYRFTPQEPGTYFITASVVDHAKRVHSASISRYASGKGRILWEMPEDNSLTIIPAQTEYKVGEKARFLVKNPYPGARALVTLERLGVIKKWSQVFKNNTPIIEFAIEPDFVPGFYLSVLLHSPRVDKPIDENNLDLGKPACRIGYLTVPVKDPVKQLIVTPKVDRKVYEPGKEVTLDIDVSDIDKNHPETEVAVAVLDEAVLDLIQGGTDYYNPYKGFYKLGPLDMKNYNLLFRLVGRQRFEKKGANAGGGGGGPDLKMRSIFKFVSYWNPAIYPDNKGHAKVSFKLPENLTGWRVLVMAVTKNDLMGLGETRFVTNKFTEILPALPNQVTEGDSFEAVFTVMNRTDNPRNIKIHLAAEGEGVEAVPVNKTLTAAPYIRNKVFLPVKVNQSGKIHFKVTAGDNLDRDGLILPLKIYKKKAVEAAATYGTTTANKVSEIFKFPQNMRADTGKVSVVVSPSVISSLEGAFEYMKQYPYFCWEQKLSKSVLAMHYINLKPYIADSLKWKNAKPWINSTLSQANSFQAPNGGMCYYIPDDSYVSPYLSAYTAIAFNWLKENGYTPDPEVETKLHKYLLNLLRRDVFPSFFSRGMASTVRAVALAALAENQKVGLTDLSRYRSHVEYMDLFGKAHYLFAATFIKGSKEIQSHTYDMIMTHANETGGKVIFRESVYGENTRGGFDRILSSDIRTNAAVLSAIISMEESHKQATDTAFKVVRYLTQSRKSRTHWENTQENAFCMQALTTFSRMYDKKIPDYTVTASMDNKTFGKTMFKDFKDPPKEFKRPIHPNDPGRKTKVVLSKNGPGRLYYSTRLFYSPRELKTDPVNSGIEVHREYYLEKDGKWVLLDNPRMDIRQGDLIRVDLFVSIPSARNFVVVADPVPGGLEPVNRDLATSSKVDADKEAGAYSGSSWIFKFSDWRSYAYSRWSFYHRELLHHSVRFYSDYLPAGNYHLSYMAQSIAPGNFYVMPLRAEEMYDPDVFGQGVPTKLSVQRQK